MYEKRDIDLCLLIPCYNNFNGLITSLRSVHYHSGRMQIVIVDDGSTTAFSISQIDAAINKNWPVHLIRLEQNQGITAALNTGLKWILSHSDAPYIARLDCGDTCMPERFTLQVNYLDANPHTCLLGTWCRFTDPVSGFSYVYKTPSAHQDIRNEMYQRNVFIHPTVMFRADKVKAAGLYPEQFPLVEDYALFWTLMNIGNTHVIDKILVVCEYNRHGISGSNRGKQLRARAAVIRAFGENKWRRLKGLLRLKLLVLLPNWLSSRLKQRM